MCNARGYSCLTSRFKTLSSYIEFASSQILPGVIIYNCKMKFEFCLGSVNAITATDNSDLTKHSVRQSGPNLHEVYIRKTCILMILLHSCVFFCFRDISDEFVDNRDEFLFFFYYLGHNLNIRFATYFAR